MIVRRAEQDGTEGLVACSSALFAEDAGSRDLSIAINIDRPRAHGPQRFASGMTDPNRPLLVADRGGEAVGGLSDTQQNWDFSPPDSSARFGLTYQTSPPWPVEELTPTRRKLSGHQSRVCAV
ncbi:hypothetical protein HEP87_23145 [Streptomyces sp. S1D4-11]|nr:hypothetical protein [Streptomyces sp. S1D4-11]QIY96382.1 hypothetical protein HEP87_23145 [Streptomyces sp. S1D4-11]